MVGIARHRSDLVGSLSLPIGRRASPGGVAALATAPALASVAAEAAPSLPAGLYANGHFGAVALPSNGFAARRREGVQFRVNGVSKGE